MAVPATRADAEARRVVPVNQGRFGSEAEALDAVVDRLVAALDPREIWLFGSRGRGEASADADFDLLVVAKPGASWGSDDYEIAHRPTRDTGVGCDVVPCSADDFDAAAALPTTLVAMAIGEGRRVHVASAR